MSFILDALRKVDRQKRDSDSGEGALGIDALHRERARRRRQLLGMAGVALVSALVTAAGLRMLSRESPTVAEELGPAEVPSGLPPEIEPTVNAPPSEPSPPTLQETPRESLASLDRDGRSPAEPLPFLAAEPPAPLESSLGEFETEDATEEEPEDVFPAAIRLVGQESPARTSSEGATTPSVPAVPVASPEVALVLQGTSVLNGRPVAVISDRRVFEGDFIDGARVIRIAERSVELELEGRRFTISF